MRTLIEIDGLNKSYGKYKVLEDISLNLKGGNCVALIGPNGSGKTTLLKILLGLTFPDSGNIQHNGFETNSNFRKKLGYMPQMSRLPEHMTVKQFFDMMRSIRVDFPKENYNENLFVRFGIKNMGPKALGKLSGGMQQKVNASLAFLFNPEVLLLDEPTAALDPMSTEHLKKEIRNSILQGKLVLITSHILQDLEGIVNDVIYLMDGRIAFRSSPERLKEETNEKNLEKMIVTKLKSIGIEWEN